MAKTKFSLYYDDETNSWEAIDESTGEIRELSFSTPKKTTTAKKSSTSKKKDEDPVAKLILEANKYTLNDAAITLMGVEADDKLDIKYERSGRTETPVIASDDSWGTHQGNRLTKSHTVSYRGKNNEKLAEFGDVFELTAHPSKEGVFILKGNRELPEEPIEDAPEEVELPDDIPFNLDELETEDNNLTEVTNLDFDFSL